MKTITVPDLKTAAMKCIRLMAQARLFAITLLWLMVILVWGTIAEKADGLYAAQQQFFSSYIIWLWYSVPLPGLLTATAVIFIGLMCRLILERWSFKYLGTIIIHIGAAVLLLGGFLTARFSHEGTMLIPPGESRNYMEDDQHVELAVTVLNAPGQPETIFSEAQLNVGSTLTDPSLPFIIAPTAWCSNCDLVRLPQPVTEGNPHGVAINFVLKPAAHDPAEEQNRAGLTFRLQHAGDRDGLYTIFQNMPIPEIITVAGKKYFLDLRPAHMLLPFSVQLLHFQEDLYPGTDKPRAFQSDVMVNDHGILWHSLISMNEPLRYKGYTLYQSSFMESTGRQTATVLAVVKNTGRLFPYLAGTIMAIGMLIHLAQRLFWRRHDESTAL